MRQGVSGGHGLKQHGEGSGTKPGPLPPETARRTAMEARIQAESPRMERILSIIGQVEIRECPACERRWICKNTFSEMRSLDGSMYAASDLYRDKLADTMCDAGKDTLIALMLIELYDHDAK
jgi:hypothetical protein